MTNMQIIDLIVLATIKKTKAIQIKDLRKEVGKQTDIPNNHNFWQRLMIMKDKGYINETYIVIDKIQKKCYEITDEGSKVIEKNKSCLQLSVMTA